MKKSIPLLLAGLALVLAGAARAADVTTSLSDAQLFQKAQSDILAIGSVAELDALNDMASTCSAVSLGQRMQHFECERLVKHYWARYNRGRSLDSFVAAVGSLFEAFDNAGANPTEQMANDYRHASVDLISVLRDINTRYGQLEKR